jgi:hypothetical protein
MANGTHHRWRTQRGSLGTLCKNSRPASAVSFAQRRQCVGYGCTVSGQNGARSLGSDCALNTPWLSR